MSRESREIEAVEIDDGQYALYDHLSRVWSMDAFGSYDPEEKNGVWPTEEEALEKEDEFRSKLDDELDGVENIKHVRPDIPSLSSTDPDPKRDVVKISGVEYTAQEAIDDLKELSRTFPERRMTRDFYRRHANIPESAWTGLFGTFAEFVRAAGLEVSRYENRIRLRAAQHASNDKLREFEKEKKSYGNRYNRDRRKRFKTLIAASDIHDRWCDPFYLRVLNETVRMVDPEIICLAGDIFDCPEFGKYNVDPREWDTVGGIRVGLDIIGGLREIAPDAQIDLIEGNHENRLLRHIAETSGSLRALLSDLHGFTVSKLFRLDDYEVNYVSNADLTTFTQRQLKDEIAKNYKVYWKTVMAHHFPHGRKKGMPGFNGHHHQHHVFSEHSARMGSYEWHQLGAGQMREASYCDASKWSNGFMICNVDTYTESVVFDYVDVGSTFSVAGGTFYYREQSEFYPSLTKELHFRKTGEWSLYGEENDD